VAWPQRARETATTPCEPRPRHPRAAGWRRRATAASSAAEAHSAATASTVVESGLARACQSASVMISQSAGISDGHHSGRRGRSRPAPAARTHGGSGPRPRYGPAPACTPTTSAGVTRIRPGRGRPLEVGRPRHRPAARLRVELHGHVGDLTLPGHQRRPQGLGNLGHSPPRVSRAGSRGVAYCGGQSVIPNPHTDTRARGRPPVRDGGNRVTIAATAGVAGVAAAQAGRPWPRCRPACTTDSGSRTRGRGAGWPGPGPGQGGACAR
jgi:hypothetical protein